MKKLKSLFEIPKEPRYITLGWWIWQVRAKKWIFARAKPRKIEVEKIRVMLQK
ncbi:MAG TPA: hypothetical protein VK742_08295 [Candidatus Sulfotelmatobacter sp.]|jgi:hypothetical protein|nr:hypothetical protein [Candidatus Sulfotelmatobacter sp.]